ncbi:DUF1444 domain-containing protein [Ornithinibacillus halophilus]|uniref:UPF0354 protein SAMN05216225_100576 n=1 Tax=Ornithinibacillus halophilus TaxID=930117 RepID=A0A1M5ELS9_9BACI|nr:DUF1444 domain-containing protein [Ornithinibacillus halophilus]SHF80157.1 Uncharacterized protein YtpQ, UPF0354 family [Ornithinibacillus halophilus]
MKMTSIKLKRILEDRLAGPNYRTSFNRDKDTFRIEWKDSKQGVTITLPKVIAKYNERGEDAIDELVDHISQSLVMMNESYQLAGRERNILPVIRSTSFPKKTKQGERLVYKEHTAETRVFYALDVGKSYRLINENMVEQEGWTNEHLDEIATFNLRSLSTEYKLDQVAGNDFYFFAAQDGYDASRILNDSLLEEMKAKSKGELAVAVPHQDVLIIVDIQNKTGYDILAQMTMKFFAEGRIPITSLAFIYEDKELTPIFILAKNKPQK